MLLLGDAETISAEEIDRKNYTPGSAKEAGELVNLGLGVIAAVDDDITAAGTGQVALRPDGCRWARTVTTTVFVVGDDVFWDASASAAVVISAALDFASGDFYLGTCMQAHASGEGDGVLYLPQDVQDRYSAIKPIVYEFDCEDDNGDVLEHILIPASQNKYGLMIEHIFAIVTEAMVGSSEDQGIVTVEDEDDNAICTLTPTDGAADAIGDYVLGVQLASTATGAAIVTVAAGKAVQGFVSQQTSGGTPAGKMKVYVVARPLI